MFASLLVNLKATGDAQSSMAYVRHTWHGLLRKVIQSACLLAGALTSS